MSRRGLRVIIHAQSGGRYVLGQDLTPATNPFALLTENDEVILTEDDQALEIEH